MQPFNPKTPYRDTDAHIQELAPHFGEQLRRRAIEKGGTKKLCQQTGISPFLRDYLFRQPTCPDLDPKIAVALAVALDLDRDAAMDGRLVFDDDFTAEAEDYESVLLRFREFLRRRGDSFPAGMKRAIKREMGER